MTVSTGAIPQTLISKVLLLCLSRTTVLGPRFLIMELTSKHGRNRVSEEVTTDAVR